MLNIQHLTKTYGEKRAIDNLSIHIAPGEIYGFIGHNGAGKTTTLKAAFFYVHTFPTSHVYTSFSPVLLPSP